MATSTRTTDLGGFAAAATAQARAEVTMRLRSHSTLIAIIALLLTTSFWIPDPSSGDSSMSWIRSTDGVRVSGTYTLGYLATISGMLWASLVTLVGFYLVTGAVRRDASTGVGLVIAATPVSRAAYVSGLFVAHVIFLLALTLIAIAVSIVVFMRYGLEEFSFWPFVLPTILLAVPAVAFTAALAVLFDVAAKSARMGHVIYVFAWALLIAVIPSALHQGLGPAARAPASDFTLYDPAGLATLSGAVYRTVPDARPGTLSMGRQGGMRIEGVAWPGLSISRSLVAGRIVSLLWAVPLLILAARRFRRFDPAGTRLVVARSPRWLATPLQRLRDAGAQSVRAAVRTRHADPIYPLAIAPGGVPGALEAEMVLVWRTASSLKWLLLLASLAAVADPGFTAVTVLLLLLAPVIAEAAAAEQLHGTNTLVWCQPAVVQPRVLWKMTGVTLLVVLIAAPAILAIAWRSPAAAPALLTALVFVAAFAVSAGLVSGGGKLFLATYALLWYMSLSAPATPLDFVAPFRPAVTWTVTSMHLIAAAVLLAIAVLVERWRVAR